MTFIDFIKKKFIPPPFKGCVGIVLRKVQEVEFFVGKLAGGGRCAMSW